MFGPNSPNSTQSYYQKDGNFRNEFDNSGNSNITIIDHNVGKSENNSNKNDNLKRTFDARRSADENGESENMKWKKISKNRARQYRSSENNDNENWISGNNGHGNRSHIFHNLMVMNGNGMEEERSEPKWVSSVSDYEKNRTITTGNSTLRLRGPSPKERENLIVKEREKEIQREKERENQKEREKEKEKDGNKVPNSVTSNRNLNAGHGNEKNKKRGNNVMKLITSVSTTGSVRASPSVTASASAIAAAGGTANMDALFWALEQQELEKQKQQEKEEMNKQIRKVKISKNILLGSEGEKEIQQMKKKNRVKKVVATVTTSDVESSDPVPMDLELSDSRTSPILASPGIKCL